MADASLTPENNGFRMGLYTAAALVTYTLLAAVLGFFSRVEAGSLDVLILVVGVTLAIARYKRAKGNRMPYLQGFGTGIMTAIVSSVAFGFFFILFALLRPDVMDQIHAQDFFGFDLSVTIAFLAIMLQGVMAGAIISLIAMQYFKSPDHKPVEGIE